MKFSDMQYTRPNLDELKERMKSLTASLRKAENYPQARAAFLEKDALNRHVETLAVLVSVRHSIDTRDDFYSAEQDFWNAAVPELEEYVQEWTLAMLESPFRASFEEEFGDLMFVNAEIALKTFRPTEEFIAAMKEENDVSNTYEKLLASAAIPFEGGVYTLSQLTPFKTDPDDERRLAAWKAEGQWYKDNQDKLDEYYDRLVHLRDRLGRMLGYDGYTQLGYYRMGRNCYSREDVEKFRSAVVKYVVPVADKVFRRQAERLGKAYPMSYADNCLEFRSGNPRPVGSPDEILAAAMDFYSDLSPETEAFFHTMLEGELLNVLSTEGKQAGGYCTGIPDYEVPFIFANFNGTQGDIEVVTHEAGHAFACWMNRTRIPLEYVWPSMEACEVHSMSMEFFAEPCAERFFGKDARKFLYSHLSGALTFIPYGTLVDHFQHVIYEKPDLTPKERHAVWKELSAVYLPWMKLDGEIPFYADGEAWQRQHHIYSSPFYYIDYCLAQTVSLQFWKMIQEDREDAWRHYMAYTEQGGSRTFTDLLKHAGLQSPFDEACLRSVCEKAEAVLETFDLSGIQ